MSWRTSSLHRFLLSAAIALAIPVLVARGAGADVLVNFDDLTVNTAVNTQYVNVTGQSGVQFDGVTGRSGPYVFSGGVTITSPPASPPNGLVNSRVEEEFSGGPVRGTFITPQRTVQVVGTYWRFNAGPATRQGILRALDAAGNPLIDNGVTLQDGPKSVTGGILSTPFSITSSQANIAGFSLDMGSGVYTILDNLQFGGGATIPPPASGPPVVTISDPSNVVDATNSGLLVNGIVAGDNLLPKVNVVIQLTSVPPILGATQVVQSGTIDLTPPNNVFQNRTLFKNLLMGNYTVTVTATNTAGQTGTSSRTFTVLADSLSRTAGFQYAFPAGNCQIAVFDGLAQALVPSTGATTIIPTLIINKWLQVRDYPTLRGDGMLGCPIAPSTPNLTVPPASKKIPNLFTQDFERGRLYVFSAAGGGAWSYTPRVFADAITAISTYSDPGAPVELRAFDDPIGTTEVGIPVGPPVMDAFGTDPTWLFQRFARPGYTGPANTIELRGPNAHPKLYIERVGGGMSDYVAALGQQPVGGDPTATVWEAFDCQFQKTAGQWQCTVVHPHIKAVTAQTHKPMYTTRGVLDRQDEFCPPSVGGIGVFVPSQAANSWTGVPLKDENWLDQEPSIADVTDVLAEGFIKGSYRSNTDLSTVHWHNHCDSTTHDVVDTGCDVVVSSLLGIPTCGDYGSALGDAAAGCWSDFVIHIRPLAVNTVDPNGRLLRIPAGVDIPPPFWSLLAANGDPTLEGVDDKLQIGDIESEWENWWQMNFTDIVGHTAKMGSLAILNGRWMIDCGHPPFHSEIHPPNGVFLNEMAPPPPALAQPPGPDAVVTQTNVWVNELYEGHPFNVSIWAPPRPTPDAQLNALFTPYNVPAGGNVFQPDGSVFTSFTNYPVTDDLIVSPDSSHVTLRLTTDGFNAAFAGPGGVHEVVGTGQVIFPRDSTEKTSGTVGRLLAQWYVGWAVQ